MNKSKRIGMHNLFDKIETALEAMPGQSVKELAGKVGVNRNLLTGYLQALEELGYVTSRQLGPARVYHNANSRNKNTKDRKRTQPTSNSRSRGTSNTFKSG